MKKYQVFSLVLVFFFLGLGIHSAFAVPVSYNQTAISIPWIVQARNSSVNDFFTNNDTHLLNMQFENNLVDNSNYYNNSTWSGSSSFVTGKWGRYAANFTGSNNILVKNQPSLNFQRVQPFSISFWYKSTTNEGTELVYQSDTFFGKGWFIDKNGNNILVFMTDGSSHTIELQEIGTSIIDGSWHQIVVTYSGNGLASGVQIFIDKTLLTNSVVSDNLGSNDFQNTNSVALMSQDYIGQGLSHGSLDDLHIFNRVLSQSEITADFNTGIYPTKPTLITNWYHYTNTATTIGQKFGTNAASLPVSSCSLGPFFTIQGENIIYDCGSTAGGTLTVKTNSTNTFSATQSRLFLAQCTESSVADFDVFQTKTYTNSYCLGDTQDKVTNFSGNHTLFTGSAFSASTSKNNQQIIINYGGVGTYARLKFFSNSTAGNDATWSDTSANCVLTYIPNNKTVAVEQIGCDKSIGGYQTRYYEGYGLQQVGNFYTNSSLALFSSIQDNPYKSILTLPPKIMGIPTSYTDFILYTPSANYLIALTQNNIYYVNVNTATSILAKNYAYQGYYLTAQTTTSNFEVPSILNQTMRLYGPSSLNTTISQGGLFTLPSPYQVQAFSASTSNGQTRIIDPQWTNIPATNYPIIWTSTQLLFPIYLTVANAPTDAGLMATNNNVVINSTQQTWAVLRLDSTHSGEYDVPAGTCQNIYIADISVKPAVYTYEGSICSTGVNQKTITYTNTLPLNFYTFTYGATHTYTPTNNQLTTTVRAGTAPFTYNVVVKNSTGAVAINSTFTSNSTLTSQNFNVSSVTKPASLYISAGGNTIYTAYLGSSLSLSSVASFFHQYFSYDGFDLISFLPICFCAMWTRNTVGIGLIMVVVFIATLSWLSIVVVPDQYIYIMAFISILGMLGYRGLYGG